MKQRLINWWRVRNNTAIFVFGSNLAGYHGGGAAFAAREQYGAEWGVGEGATGRSYALPTMDEDLQPRELRDIAYSVDTFIEYAELHPGLTFLVTKVGCGIAGFKESQIGPMFEYAPDNCVLPDGWRV